MRVDVFSQWFRVSDIGILIRCDIKFRWITQNTANGVDFCSQTAPDCPQA